jgi:N-acetylneuraminic acid mutarotase
MLRNGVFLLSLLLLLNLGHAQNVGIGTPTPHPSAVLDVTATDKGLLPPRLTTAQRDGILSPARGLSIYNTDTDCMEFWNGTRWVSVCATVAPCSPPPASTPGGNTPVCEGATLNLTATPVVGATYVWSGPGGFTSTAQNPTIANVTLSQGGTYTLRTWLLGCYSDPTTLDVHVEPQQWIARASFPGPSRGDPVIFGLGGKLYVGGGYNGSSYFNDFYEYDPGTNSWNTRATVPGPLRYAPSSWSTANYGYTSGGFQLPGTTYQTTYRYDAAANSWITVANAPGTFVHANVNVANAATTGYVAGGKNSSCGSCTCYNNFIYQYNEGSNSWTTEVWPFARRAYPAIVEHNGQLYVGMGQSWDACPNSYTDWWHYNPGTDTWTARATYPGTTGAKSASWSDGTYVYVVDNTLAIYRYDPVANTWSTGPCPAPVSGYTVFVGGKMYLVNTAGSRQVYEYNP